MEATPTVRGIYLMILGVSFLSFMDSAVKWLLLQDISAIEIIAVRGWLISGVLLLMLPRYKGWKTLQTQHFKLHLIRALIGFFAPLMFFISLKYLPLADTTAIFFCTTFFMTAGSKIFLGESVGIHRWAAVIVGFIGVVMVASPGTDTFQYATAFPVLAGASYAVIILTGRVLSRTDSSIKLVFYFNVVNTIIASIAVPFFWTTPTPEVLWMIVLVSGLALGGYFSLTNAFILAPVSAIAPIEYLSLVWATFLGYLFWDEIPTPLAWGGMVLILVAGLYIVWRESRHRPTFTP